MKSNPEADQVMEEKKLVNSKGYIFKELQTVISIFYLLMVGIGMLFEFQKYWVYKINIFQYADVFDFLIAPFRDTRIFIFVFGTMVLIYLLIKFDSLLYRRFPKFYSVILLGIDNHTWFKYYRTISFVCLFIIYIFLSSTILAKANQKSVALKTAQIKITFADNQVLSGTLIGKTKETIFLLSGGATKIIPAIALVKEIELE